MPAPEGLLGPVPPERAQVVSEGVEAGSCEADRVTASAARRTEC